MKVEKTERDTVTLADESVPVKNAAPKKKKKDAPQAATPAPSPDATEAKPVKAKGTAAKPKIPKTSKMENPEIPTDTEVAKPAAAKAAKTAVAKAAKPAAAKAAKTAAAKDDKAKAPKTAKLKLPKETKPKAPKEDKLKAPKDDKPTKFMVSMKKSVRKSIKKEAAEAGVSMNEYIVLAVLEKLHQNS